MGEPLAPNAGGANPVFLAARFGHTEVLLRLLSAPQCSAEHLTAQSRGSGSALHQALLHSDAAAAALLADERVDVAAPKRDGTTPLELALLHRSCPVVRELLARGASPLAPSWGGASPLQIALERGLRDPDSKFAHVGELIPDPSHSHNGGWAALPVNLHRPLGHFVHLPARARKLWRRLPPAARALAAPDPALVGPALTALRDAGALDLAQPIRVRVARTATVTLPLLALLCASRVDVDVGQFAALFARDRPPIQACYCASDRQLAALALRPGADLESVPPCEDRAPNALALAGLRGAVGFKHLLEAPAAAVDVNAERRGESVAEFLLRFCPRGELLRENLGALLADSRFRPREGSDLLYLAAMARQRLRSDTTDLLLRRGVAPTALALAHARCPTTFMSLATARNCPYLTPQELELIAKGAPSRWAPWDRRTALAHLRKSQRQAFVVRFRRPLVLCFELLRRGRATTEDPAWRLLQSGPRAVGVLVIKMMRPAQWVDASPPVVGEGKRTAGSWVMHYNVA